MILSENIVNIGAKRRSVKNPKVLLKMCEKNKGIKNL
jgi:hypothetical protein